MKLRPVTKPDKWNKTIKKIWWSCHVGKLWHYCHFTDLWLIWSNCKAGFWSQSVKLTFSIIVTFYLTQFENIAKISLTQLSHYRFEERYFAKKMLTFCKEYFLTLAKLRVLSGTERYIAYLCVLTCQISSF